MKKISILTSVVAVGSFVALSSCSSKLGNLSADNFNVTPTPLETEAGRVPLMVNGVFPEKYMKKKAVVTIVPELRYGNGQAAQGVGQTFQGEKVLGNDQTIFYRTGGRYTMKSSIAYTPEMQKSDLYMTFKAKVGKKEVEIPAVKVGYGVIATSELYKKALFAGGAIIAPDSFQRIVAQKQEASVKFLINQATLRASQLKSRSIKDFIKMLRTINDDEALELENVEVAAYASPEGGVKFNDKLANNRKKESSKYVNKQLRANKVETDVDAHYTAQDWDGFQKLVQASNIQDKEVILRVLSMYTDPEEREKQIRNMSEGFRELATSVLPELRRSRLIINYNVIGRTDSEIQAQYKEDASKLSNDELLYAATLEKDIDKKEDIYKTTTRLYPNDYRAYNNVAAMELAKGNEATAKTYLAQAIEKNADAKEAIANRGLIALLNGDMNAAENDIAKASGQDNIRYAIGNLNIAKGKYVQAVNDLNGTNTNAEGLAKILTKDYAGAARTLDAVKNPTGITEYLHAIAMARQGNKYAANSHLKDALQMDPSLKAYADNDLELKSIK